MCSHIRTLYVVFVRSTISFILEAALWAAQARPLPSSVQLLAILKNCPSARGFFVKMLTLVTQETEVL